MIRSNSAAPFIAVLTALSFTTPCRAQISAAVTVDASKSLGAFPAQGIGSNTVVWDLGLMDAQFPGLMRTAGTTILRFPGGSASDAYHWQTNSPTAGQGAFVLATDNFDAFMAQVNAMAGTAIITVNYGSNAAGTAGGDPNEAAAWVAYANKTKKYGVKYWEIGNEQYGNGEYGANWEMDLHSSHTPSTYGANVATFAKAMKAKDSTIKVGAVLIGPGEWPDGNAPDWNSNVLTQCGKSIDFVIVHWYPQGPGGESDSGLLNSTLQVSACASKVKALIQKYCGSNAKNVQIFITEINSVTGNPGKQTVSLVNALFLADNVMTWLEGGASSVDWWASHGGPNTSGNNSNSLYGSLDYGDYGILSSGIAPEPASETPFVTYFASEMLTALAMPGDTIVTATSSQSLISAHAVKQADGNLALLLINKDPSNSYKVKVSLSNFTPASKANLYTFGEGSTKIGSSTASGIGASFSQTIKPYSLTTLVIPPSGGTPATTATKVSASSVTAGSSVTVTTTVTAGSAAISNGVIDLELCDAWGGRIAQKTWTGETLSAKQSQTLTWSVTPPAANGTYTIAAGVFTTSLAANLAWSPSAASFKVTGGDGAQYGFENGAAAWASSGGMITGIAPSATHVYAGANSLAVSIKATKSDTQYVFTSGSCPAPGKNVSFHIWIPSGSAISAVQPYIQQGGPGNWTWTGNYVGIGSLKTNAWNTITVTVPSDAATPLFQLGVEFYTSGAWTGTCYIDSIGW